MGSIYRPLHRRDLPMGLRLQCRMGWTFPAADVGYLDPVLCVASGTGLSRRNGLGTHEMGPDLES